MSYIDDALSDGFTLGTTQLGTTRLVRDDIVLWVGDTGRVEAAWTNHGSRAITIDPDSYDPDAFERARRECSKCGQGGDPARLRRFRFAEALCPECDTPEYRAKGEFPGWAD